MGRLDGGLQLPSNSAATGRFWQLAGIENAKASVPAPVQLLFGPRPTSAPQYDCWASSPLAALISEDDARLLFREEEFNADADSGPRSWELAARAFFLMHPMVA